MTSVGSILGTIEPIAPIVGVGSTLGGASIAVGYTGYDANSNTSSLTDVTASTSLGGGVSLFAEFSSLTGAGAAAETNSTSETTMAVGTKISF